MYKELDKFNGVRSYSALDKMIENISDWFHRLVARIQYDGGARIDEVFDIVPESLKV